LKFIKLNRYSSAVATEDITLVEEDGVNDANNAKNEQERMMRNEKYKPIISQQIKSDGCVIYIKGTPQAPKCGFSRAVVQTLDFYGAKYKYYDVLKDSELRLSLVDYSDWPSLPQIYLGGVFVGGGDIVLQYHIDNMLKSQLIACGSIDKNWVPTKANKNKE